MKLISTCCMIFPLLLTPLSSQAEQTLLKQSNQPLNYVIGDIYKNPKQPKAYFRDTVLWPYNATTQSYNIPVCWEYPAQSTTAEKQLVQTTLQNSWQAYSLVKFTGWGQCPVSGGGIRITVEDSMSSPRAALGREGDGKKGVMLLNFKMNTWFPSSVDPIYLLTWDSFQERCLADSNANLETCIRFSVIHEFGHVLGLAHEFNRTDEPWQTAPRGSCDTQNSYTLTVGGNSYQQYGNTLFTDYDPQSMMNYCRNNYFGRTDLTYLDKLALRVYYGNMPSYDEKTRILKIPRIEKSSTSILTGSFALSTDGHSFQRIGNLISTTTPSKSSATFSSWGTLTIPEIKYIPASGHVNQIIKATLQENSPGIFTINLWQRMQPTLFIPIK